MIDITHYLHCIQKQVFFRRALPHILIIVLIFLSTNVVHAERFVWFGSYTGKTPRGQGIYVSRYNEKTGDISQPDVACTVKNPSFLAIHPTLAVAYAVSEIADLNGQPTGGIISFTIDMENGHLTQQSVQPVSYTHLTLPTICSV